jgi:hypothetical protein
MRGPSATPSTPQTVASPADTAVHPAALAPDAVPVARTADRARNTAPLPAARATQPVAHNTLHNIPPLPVDRGSTGPLAVAHPLSGPAQLSARSGVFLAYSHRDRDLLGELQKHLKPLQKAWMLDLWDDLRVDSGPRGAAELRRAVDTARVALLLISPGFLASPFVAEHALPVTLAMQQHPRAAVMCLYLRPAMDVFAEYRYRDPRSREDRSVRITSFHALNDPTCPLASQTKPAREGILAAAAEEIIAAAHRGAATSFSENFSPAGP